MRSTYVIPHGAVMDCKRLGDVLRFSLITQANRDSRTASVPFYGFESHGCLMRLGFHFLPGIQQNFTQQFSAERKIQVVDDFPKSVELLCVQPLS